ncbi:MAG: RNA methyltransferase [Bdellovibrionaceae bacterium]|nr:RNA methyltransferase [Pseudobdellovibrionaceae bacterium]
MPTFVAITSPGLTDALKQELLELGIEKVRENARSVEFEGNWEMCYRANLGSRVATRILLPILEFPAYKPEDIYHNCQKHDFTKYVEANGNLWVDAKVEDSALKDQRLLAMKVKDAVVDQFRDKFGERPSVNKDDGLSLYLRGYNNKYVLSVDTSAPALNKRGYRVFQNEAPLKENVAAGLLTIAGWDEEMPIVDPFCGSGTILIEAALRYLKRAPGTLRKSFSVQKLNIFKEDSWEAALDYVIGKEKEDVETEESQVRFYGYDIDGKAIKMARENARQAGVDHLIEFKRLDVVELTAPVPKGLVISNPPYGIRVGDEFFLSETYKNFAYALKSNFKDWDVWILSGNKELTQHLSMRAERRYPIINGGIDCRFIHYKVKK